VPFPTVPLEIVRYAVPGYRVRAVVNSGKTYRPEEAIAAGLVDEVVPADSLAERAHALARHLGSIPAGSFRMTKLGLRADAIARMDRKGEYHQQAMAAWSDPATHQHLRDYLARSLGRG
jgi:enoyl-CoA hydratase